MKRKTINIKPFDGKIKIENDGFVLTFIDHSKEINIKFEDWWITYIARKLNFVIADRQKKIDGYLKAMRDED
jgi:hypothetical protein